MKKKSQQKYSNEYLLQIALKFETIASLDKALPNIASLIRSRKIRHICFKHMKPAVIAQYYTLTYLRKITKPYKLIIDFAKDYPKEAGYIRNHQLGKKVYAFKKYPVKYTNLEIKTIAKKFNTMADLTRKHPDVAAHLYKRKLIKKYCTHMKPVARRLTNKELFKIAQKFTSRKDFQDTDPGAYMTLFRRKLLEKACSHIPKLITQYTDEELIAIAKKYRRRSDFQSQDHSAYTIARNRGIIDKCFKHMIPPDSESAIPLEELMEVASKYKYRSTFGINDRNYYEAARRRNLLDKICSHMVPKPHKTYYSENQVLKFIQTHYPDALKKRYSNIKFRRRPYIKGFELDAFVPSLNKAIEFDGVYWHSKKMMLSRKRKWPTHARINYHKIKDEYFNKYHNIQILHITDIDWSKKRKATEMKIIEFLTS